MWTKLGGHRSFMPQVGMTEKIKYPAYPQALFKIASITKLYVAVATAKLVKDGRLSLDKTLADYFPELVGRIENSDKITLQLMLQHRSGIPNFVDHPDYWTKPPKNRKKPWNTHWICQLTLNQVKIMAIQIPIIC